MADEPRPNSVEEMRKWIDIVKKMFDGAPPEQQHDMLETVREIADDWGQQLNEPAPVRQGVPLTEPAPAPNGPAITEPAPAPNGKPLHG